MTNPNSFRERVFREAGFQAGTASSLNQAISKDTLHKFLPKWAPMDVDDQTAFNLTFLASQPAARKKRPTKQA